MDVPSYPKYSVVLQQLGGTGATVACRIPVMVHPEAINYSDGRGDGDDLFCLPSKWEALDGDSGGDNRDDGDHLPYLPSG
jgi:hypothetical protein